MQLIRTRSSRQVVLPVDGLPCSLEVELALRPVDLRLQLSHWALFLSILSPTSKTHSSLLSNIVSDWLCSHYKNSVDRKLAVSYVKEIIPESAVAAYLDPKAPQSSGCPLTSPRMKCYPYMVCSPVFRINIVLKKSHFQVQEALEQKLLLDGTKIPPSAFSIAPAIASGEFTLPPTYIIHGT